MSRETLGIYLNDHLTGAVFAVEMLERLVNGDHPALPTESLRGLLAEIQQDRDILRGLLEKTEVEEQLVKKAAAWLTEKLGRVKLDDGPLGRMEMLETLALGILGKHKLWMALEQVASRYPGLADVDYPGLQTRAREQHDLVEDLRIKAALLVL